MDWRGSLVTKRFITRVHPDPKAISVSGIYTVVKLIRKFSLSFEELWIIITIISDWKTTLR